MVGNNCLATPRLATGTPKILLLLLWFFDILLQSFGRFINTKL